MNYKLKFLLMILCIFIATGCDVTYDLNIYDDKINEKVEFIEQDMSLLDKKYQFEIEDNEEYTYRGLIEADLKKQTSAFISDEDLFFKKKKLTDNNGIGEQYTYQFTEENYSDAFIPNSSFKYFNFIQQKDTFIISTNSGIDAFDQYNYLDNIYIHINTNHKVKQSNADNIEGNDYYWNINKSNSNNKSIYFEYYKDDYVFDSNKVVKITIIILSIVGVIFIIILFMLKRKNNNNKI